MKNLWFIYIWKTAPAGAWIHRPAVRSPAVSAFYTETVSFQLENRAFPIGSRQFSIENRQFSISIAKHHLQTKHTAQSPSQRDIPGLSPLEQSASAGVFETRNCVSKTRNCVLKTKNCVLKTRNCALKTRNIALKMMNYAGAWLRTCARLHTVGFNYPRHTSNYWCVFFYRLLLFFYRLLLFLC